MIMITVLVCVYDNSDTLDRSLRSAQHQTLDSSSYEVIVVNDGSTDNGAEIAEKYAHQYSNFHHIQLAKNQGLTQAANHGLKKAKGKYFIRLDADDAFAPEILLHMSKLMDAENTDLVCSDRYEIWEESSKVEHVKISEDDIYQLIAGGVMMRTSLLRKIGGYRSLFWEEYDLFIRYLTVSKKRALRVPQPLYSYYRGPHSMTASPNARTAGWSQLKEHWDEGALHRFGVLPKEAYQLKKWTAPNPLPVERDESS